MASPIDFNSFLVSPPVPDLTHYYASTGSGPPRASAADPSVMQTYGQPMDVDGAAATAPAQSRARNSSASTPFFGIEDPMAYGLNPDVFSSNVSFQMPSFLSGGAFVGDQQSGPAYVEAPAHTPSYALPPSSMAPPPLRSPSQQSLFESATRPTAPHRPSSTYGSKFKGGTLSLNTSALPFAHSSVGQQGGGGSRSAFAPNSPTVAQQPGPQSAPPRAVAPVVGLQSYTPHLGNPIFSGYGSSFVSITPDKKPFASMPPLPPALHRSQTRSGRESPGFDAHAPGMPQAIGGNFPGLYSSSGFDMLGVLARVAARPNPQINVGPVDTSASFLVVDARRYDFPIVFASQTFSHLTGYAPHEIIGRNCRFLQAPGGDVAQGSRRKYTDGNAAYHMKMHILSGKESQASVINYRKDGTPFINLVTIIPITWDSDEISYFVGFQVDLVDQPNAILEKMKDGTYVVNYSLLPNQPFAVGPNAVAQPASPRKALESQHDVATRTGVRGDFGNTPSAASGRTTVQHLQQHLQSLQSVQDAPTAPMPAAAATEDAPFGDEDDVTRRAWYKLLLENAGDFIHVLSLKGSFLYVSPTSARALEYDASELIGKTIQSICHPSDIVPVMRELKESGAGGATARPLVSLLYRIRRKNSGYVWIEAQGRLHVEQGKGRKCVILLGRQRSVYNISWAALGHAGGLGDHELWAKVSLDGTWLYATAHCEALLGRAPVQLVGSSLLELVPAEQHAQVLAAFATAAAGTTTSLRHDLRDRRGDAHPYVSTVHAPVADAGAPAASWVVVQINTAGSEDRRRRNPTRPPLSALRSRSSSASISVHSTDADAADGAGGGAVSDAPSSYSAVPSTFKTLAGHPSLATDNMFDELDTTRSTSWQFELHQLQLTNKRLREERDQLLAVRKKRQRKSDPAPRVSSSGAKQHRKCANCGKEHSPEWRRGPNDSTLCNACGLRWSKSQSRSAASTPSDVGPEVPHSPGHSLFSLPSAYSA